MTLFFLIPMLFLAVSGLAQDAANITKPSQADLLVGTRVPRGMTWSTPTKEERLRVLWRGLALSPGAYIRSTFTATSHHLDNKPKDFGQGWGAYAKRNLNSFATFSLQDVASEGLAAATGYEMRYIQCKCTKVLPRIKHALWFNLVTYNREGKTVVNWPNIAGSYSVGMLSTAYTPNQKWSAQGIQMGNSAMAFGFVSSLLQEFTPGRLLRFRKKKTTKEAILPPPVEISN